jgi:hypothetical protein
MNITEAKSLIGKRVSGQRPNTFNEANRVFGVVVSVRESISDYGSWKPFDILVDIENSGTVTPCLIDSVNLA